MKTNFPQSRTISVSHSVAFLPEDSALLRKPRFGWRARPEKFYAGFEQKIVFYDCFWHADGKRVLLVGPPPRNLLPTLEQARYSADKSENALTPKFYISQSVMILELADVPAKAKTITISAPNTSATGMNFELEIQPNFSEFLADKRIMFTLSKDNDLDWISAWADYYHHFHGVNAIVLVDNGSTKTTLSRMALALQKTRIEHIFILSMPYIYGEIDPGVVFNPYWTHFLQIGVMSIVLRRFAARAEGLINCDIDELMTLGGAHQDVFAELKRTPNGLLSMRGQWVEAYSEHEHFGDHRDFAHQLTDEKQRAYKQRKWVLDPKKPWAQNLNVHPYMHWIEGRPGGAKTTSQDSYYWHFKGINNNWKTNRNTGSNSLPTSMELDQKLVDRFAQWSPDYGSPKTKKPE